MPAGRPEIKFDLRRVEILGTIHAPYHMVAAEFDVTERTIAGRMADKTSDFCIAYEKGKKKTSETLRSAQLSVAFGKGRSQATMLIWLGKVLLNQMEAKDRAAIETIPAIQERVRILEQGKDQEIAERDAKITALEARIKGMEGEGGT